MNRSTWLTVKVRTLAITSACLLGLSLSACSQDETAAQTVCETPRPEMCAQVYEPVCATTASGDQRTYPNSCHACMDDKVQSQSPGKCQSSQ